MRDRTTIPTNQPLNNLKIMKTALLLTAGLLLTGATAAVVVPAINGTAAPAQRVITELAAGTATFQHATAETADTFTFTTQVFGIEAVQVTFNDGVKVNYSPNSTDLDQVFITTNGSTSEGTIKWDGQTAVITNGNNTTKLGGFKTAFNKVLSNRVGERQAEEAAQAARAERQAELETETFDGMISRISKQVCVRAEGLSYITENSIINQAMNPVVRTGFEASETNRARWNGMNRQLRSQQVLGAMAWDCNSVILAAAENDFNNAALGLGLLLNNY
jgi:hypothetical protein